jgi:HK97 family phage portal protein
MDDLITTAAKSLRRARAYTLARPLRNAPQFSSGGAGGGMFGAGSDAIGTGAYDAYGAVGTLFAIVSQLSNAVARTPWHMYPRTTASEIDNREEIINHAFVRVWNSPNDFYTGRLFRETIQQHLDLVGEAVIVLYRFGTIVYEMWPVRPDRIHPIKHPTKFLTGYKYRAPDGEEVPLELENVIHIKMPNPADPYRGMGPVQSVLADIDAAKYSAEWNRNFFINGARPGGIIKVDHKMQDAEFQDLIKRWQLQHKGVANAHRVAVLENADWVDTKFSMEDMQFVELRNLPRETIREAFAFPKPMLGTVEDVNRANAQAGKEVMAENHTIPRLDRIKDIVDARLLPKFANGASYEFCYEDPTPVNHEDEDRARTSKATAASALVAAGYDPADVLAAMQLPKMRYVGKPQAPVVPTAPTQPNVPARNEYDPALSSIIAMHSAGSY